VTALALLLIAGAPAPPPITDEAAAEMVELLGIASMVRRLPEVAGEEELRLRLEIDARIAGAVIDLDQVNAALDREHTDVEEMREWGMARQTKHVDTLNLTVGILAGGAAIGTGLTISDRTSHAGAIVGTVAGVAGCVVSLLAARGAKRPRPPFTVGSRMLAPFFGGSPDGLYPPLVWAYLDRRPPGGTRRRRDDLVAAWRRVGHVPSGIGPADRAPIAERTEPIPAAHPIDLDALSDRALMLRDVRAEVARFKAGLGAVLASIRAQAGPLHPEGAR
jgi:hypothetical protein